MEDIQSILPENVSWGVTHLVHHVDPILTLTDRNTGRSVDVSTAGFETLTLSQLGERVIAPCLEALARR